MIEVVTSIVAAVLILVACQGQADTATAAPLPLLSAGRAPAGPFFGTTDFQLRLNTIIVPVSFGDGGSDAGFIMDSGAPMTISAALQTRGRFPTIGEVEILGPEGGVLPVPVSRLDRLEVAGIAFEDIGGVVAWVEPPNPVACLSGNGLLGASLLRTAIWQIDFTSRKLIVTNELGKLDHVKDVQAIPFTRGDSAGSPRIPVKINDSQSASLLVDLGFNGSLAIPVDLYRGTGNVITAAMPQGEGMGSATVFGQKAASRRIGSIRELQIGDLTLADFPVETGPSVSDFHIGIDFLRHFVVTIDWLNNVIYLDQAAPVEALYPRFESYGFSPEFRDGGLEVGFLWENSPAARAGMRVGDRLLEIGGAAVTRPTFDEFCAIVDSIGLFGEGPSSLDLVGERNGDVLHWQIGKASLLDSK